MATFIIALLIASGAFSAAHFGFDAGYGFGVLWGILAFAAFQATFAIVMRKRVKRDMDEVQRILLDGQKALQAKTSRWQMRPPGSIAEAQREIAADTRKFVLAALAATERLSRYRLWVPMMMRQMATAQLQLNWMIKDFKKVDALMPKAMLIDPTMVAMKMARMYMLDAKTEEIGKVYEKGARRVRYNGNVLLAATWSWILVRRGDADGAFKALTEALRKSDNETLKRNHQELMNNRVAHFNNSGLGDQWYALYLEEPKIHTQRQRSAYR